MNQAHRISTEKPPIWDKISAAFGVEWKDIAVTYGNTIYSPNPVEDDILAHELVHVRQQFNDKDGFVDRYIDDPKFRYKAELEVYRVQYGFWKKYIKNREELDRALTRMATELSSHMYGNCVSYQEARKQIRNGR